VVVRRGAEQQQLERFMPYGLYLSAAGANAQSHRLEVLSHNMANINTSGFKPQLAMLQSRHGQAVANGDATPGTGSVDDLGGGIQVQPTRTSFTQGPIKRTANPTDFAINDERSFFAVRKGDKELLTRAGNFLFDAQGRLVTPSGHEVVGAGGATIRIDPNQPWQVADDGAIVQAGARQQLRLVQPLAVGDLARVGENLFESLTQAPDAPPQQRNVISGALEHSAVEPTAAMMELIETSRMYEANIRMIQTQDDAMGQLINRVLRQG
jgi:flagellar basal-body rod protein FlgF